MKRKLIALAAVFALLVTMTACGGQAGSTSSEGEAEQAKTSRLENLSPKFFNEEMNHDAFLENASFQVPKDWKYSENAPERQAFFTTDGGELDMIYAPLDEGQTFDKAYTEWMIESAAKNGYTLTLQPEEMTMHD